MIARRRTARAEYRVPTSVGALTFEGCLVLIDRAASRLFVYNESARLIWDGLLRGQPVAGLIDELSDAYGVPSARVSADLATILDHWAVEGLIEPCGGSAAPGRAAPGRMRAASDETGRSNDPARQSERWVCTIRGHAIEFDIAGAGWISFVRRMFAHLGSHGVQPQSSISIRPLASSASLRAEGEAIQTDGATSGLLRRLAPRNAGQASQACLVVDGRERLRTDNPGLLIGGLYQALLERIHPGIEWLALMHGGAIARDGAALVLPAPSGNGKTTLFAHLMTQGFRYLADDLVPLAAPEGLVVPWPMPLSVKSGSWDMLGDAHPDMREAPTFLTRGMETRLLVPPQDVWDAGRTPVRAMIFPRYDPAATGELAPISRADALQRLLADRIWLGHPLAVDRVRAFLAWLEGIPAFTLTYRRLDQALPGIEKALAT